MIYSDHQRFAFSREERNGVAVLLKTVAHESTASVAREQLHHEFDLQQRLDHPNLIQALDFLAAGAQPILVLADDAGELLGRKLESAPLTIRRTLEMGVGIASGIAELHSQNIVHRNLTPESISIGEDGIARILDLSLATVIPRQQVALTSPSYIAGDLSYISPEQTGRTSRVVDHRSDLYSFGIVLYQMFTGKLPLTSEDPLELVHDHLAVRPANLREMSPNIPRIIGDLVALLLEKDPDDRYRSAVGVLRDLNQILDAIVRGLDPDSLDLAGVDISLRFQFSDRLYGRERELERLNHCFEQSVLGETQLMFVHGYSGVGKSSLVQELRTSVVKHRGYFAYGKFDQLNKTSAQSAVVDAFNDIVRQLLTEDDAAIEIRGQQLRDALGDGAGVLAEVVTGFDLLIGDVSPPEKLDAQIEHNRFNRLVSVFLATISSPHSPLVIVLDDLQWADSATLEFIEQTLHDVGKDSLMIIGGYRDNEVTASHPVNLLRQRLAERQLNFQEIALEPLSDEAMSEFVADALGRNQEDAAPLTQLCIRKTGSNPYFTRLFLSSLYEEELLQLDAIVGSWSWDMEQISAKPLTDNMVTLAMDKVKSASEPAQRLLSVMSIIGVSSDIQLLSDVFDLDPSTPLLELASQELVTLTERQEGSEWQFSHDRIQEAASARLNDAQKRHWHEKIGQVLQQRLVAKDVRTSLFRVLRHLNSVEQTSPVENESLAALNLEGGAAAMRATAYEAALRYYKEGEICLGSAQWQTHPDLAFGLHIGAARAARLATEFDQLRHWLDAIYASATKIEHRIQALRLELLYLADNTNDNLASVAVARTAFAQLGWNPPANPSTARVLAGMLRTRVRLNRYSTDDLQQLAVMSDETAKLLMAVLNDSVASAYWVNPNLMALIIFKALSLTTTYGNDTASPSFYAAFGMVLSGIVGIPESGLKYANLAVELAEQLGTEALPSRVRFIRDTLVAPAILPLREIDASLEVAYIAGTEMGDLGYATGAFFFRGLHRLLSGTPLDHLEPDIEAAVGLLQRHAQVRNLGSALALRQFVYDLRNAEPNANPFTGPYSNAVVDLKTADQMTSFWTYSFRAMARYHTDDIEGAFADIVAAETFLDAALGQALVPAYHLYGVLCGCAKGSKTALSKAQIHLKKLTGFAKHNPLDHQAKVLLAQGAMALVTRKPKLSLQYLDEAAALGSERTMPVLVGLASSLAANIKESMGDEMGATGYRTTAHEAYQNWGAHGLTHRIAGVVKEAKNTDLDLETVVRASEAISEQIELGDLLNNLMVVMLQNAGAESGSLFRLEDGVILPDAHARFEHASNDVVVTTNRSKIEQDVPDSVVRLVARTVEPVISNRALADPTLGSDHTIQQRQVRSLLCLPLVNQGRLQGILYLENNQTDGAFTAERYRLLRVLAGQAASALEKARLHDAQKRLIEAQFRFVPGKFLQNLGHDNLLDVQLGEGAIRHADVLFTDIRGFTTIVEKLSPNEAMKFLNGYLAHMEPIVHQHGGFIDRYDGDAILALFDAGESDNAAVQCAIAMAEAERLDNEVRNASGLPAVRTGLVLTRARSCSGLWAGKPACGLPLLAMR